MVREKGIEIKQRLDDFSPEDISESVKTRIQEAVAEGRTAAVRTKEDLLSTLDEMTSRPAAGPSARGAS